MSLLPLLHAAQSGRQYREERSFARAAVSLRTGNWMTGLLQHSNTTNDSALSSILVLRLHYVLTDWLTTAFPKEVIFAGSDSLALLNSLF
jgi:hypothetical protein